MLQYDDIQQLAALVRESAKAELVPRFATGEYRNKADGSMISQADLAMQQRLQRELAARWPQVAFLGEEMSGAQQHALLSDMTEYLWCLDPLDGTTNFVAGNPYFCVSLALLHAGEPVAGVVCDPLRDECFTALKGEGAWLNGERLDLSTAKPMQDLAEALVVVDFKRLPAALAMRLVKAPPYRSQRNFGSTALEWCWLAAARFHCYLHGGMKLWDYAAGVLVLAEAGGVSANLEGEPVISAGLPTRSVVAAQNPALFEQWQKIVASNK